LRPLGELLFRTSNPENTPSCCRNKEQPTHPDYMLCLILIRSCTKTNLMHKLFVVHFVNLYMFRAYISPSSGGTTVCIQQMVFIIPFRRVSVVLGGLVPIQRGQQNIKKWLLSSFMFFTLFPNV
jgi:hypothetical protein